MAERIEFVDLGRAYAELREEIDAAIARVCSTSAFVGGPEVAAFEAEWAAFTGARHAIGVANGTHALELALRALELPPGGRVLVPANTFIATAEAVAMAGLACRFVDVDPDTGLIDLERCREALDDDVVAIVPVHLYGRLAPMDDLLALAGEHDVVILEDAAQAHGARRGGRHAGTFGRVGTFSFYPGKNLGAFGDAGAVVTDDDGLADRIRLMRDHGRRGRDEHEVIGTNARLDGLQAAVLRAKLPHLEAWGARRRAVAEAYRAGLPPELLDFAAPDDAQAESHHLFPVLLDRRDELAERLSGEGIATGVHYRVPVPCTQAFGGNRGTFPAAEARAARQLSLPIHPHLSEADVERVAAAVSALA